MLVLWCVFWVGYFCLGGAGNRVAQDPQDCFGVFLLGDFEKNTPIRRPVPKSQVGTKVNLEPAPPSPPQGLKSRVLLGLSVSLILNLKIVVLEMHIFPRWI